MTLSPAVESALYHCGRERVLHREDPVGATVAIRYDIPSLAAPGGDGIDRFLTRKGASIDEAGAAAAAAFAAHLRARAKETIEWADRIERALARGAEGAP